MMDSSPENYPEEENTLDTPFSPPSLDSAAREKADSFTERNEILDIFTGLAIATPEASLVEREALIHNIERLRQAALTSELVTVLRSALEKIEASSSGIHLPTVEEIDLELINQFPELCSAEREKSLFHLVTIGIDRFNRIIKLVPLANFFFQPVEEKAISVKDRIQILTFDRKPKADSFAERVFELSDVSLFDPCGQEVFRGDLMLSDLKNISGPLYLASQQDFFQDAPAWAFSQADSSNDTSVGAETSDERQVGGSLSMRKVHTEYLRLFALGMVEGGVYFKNIKELPKLDDSSCPD